MQGLHAYNKSWVFTFFFTSSHVNNLTLEEALEDKIGRAKNSFKEWTNYRQTQGSQ